MEGIGKNNFDYVMQELGADLKKMLYKANHVSLVYATVYSVDESNRTMSALVDGTNEIYNIPLDVSFAGNNTLLYVPTLNSDCVLGFIEDIQEVVFVVAFSSIDKIIIRQNFNNENDVIEINDTTINIKRGNTTLIIEDKNVSLDTGGGNIIFNGGQQNGLVLAQNLVNIINDMADKFNIFTSHVHMAQGSLSGPAQLTSGDVPNFSIIEISDIENPNIKQ